MRFDLIIKVDGNITYQAGGEVDEPLGKILHKYVSDYMVNYYNKEISKE